jgi:hydroxymethylpyrimidine/phosphomethylpyrimidine kinase
MSTEKLNQLDEIAQIIAIENFKIMQALPTDGTIDPIIPMVTRTFRFYLQLVILHVLNSKYKEGMTKEEAYEAVQQNFLVFKSLLQDNIAEGFDAAFKTYAGQTLDYYCIISPFPKPVNKEMI